MKALGVDVGTHSIKLILLRQGWFGPKVLASAVRPVGDREPAEVARELIAEWADRADAICWSLDRRLLASREIHLPFTREEQIEDAFPYAAEGRIPMSLPEALIDYRIEGEDPAGGSKVTVLAYPKKDFEDRARRLGVENDEGATYHLDALANLNALLDLPESRHEAGEIIGLLDVGATKACLDLVMDGAPVFTRTFLTAGEKVDEAIAREFDLEHDEAESMKVEGLSRAGGEETKVVPRRLMGAVTPVYERLAEDLRHSLRAFHERRPGLRLARLHLSGGSALAPFLKDFLADHLGVECRLLEPPLLLKTRSHDSPPPVMLTTALGLALWATGRGEVELDFVREREAPLLLRPSNLGLLALTIVCACAFHYHGARGRLADVERRASELERQIEQQLSSLKDGGGATLSVNSSPAKLREAIERARELSSHLERKGPSALAVLDALAALIPRTRMDEILVDSVSVEERNVQITGRADSYETVDVLKLAIEESPLFGDVSFGDMNNRGVSGPKRLRFQLSVMVAPGKDGE